MTHALLTQLALMGADVSEAAFTAVVTCRLVVVRGTLIAPHHREADWCTLWDFAVRGVPVSAQSNNAKRKRGWTAGVRAHAAALVGEFPLSHPVAVGVTYFYDVDTWNSRSGERLDVDNFLKPIVDGLWPEIIVDDQLVRDVSGSRRPLDPNLRFINPSEALVDALSWQNPFVFVRIGLPVEEEEIIWIGV